MHRAFVAAILGKGREDSKKRAERISVRVSTTRGNQYFFHVAKSRCVLRLLDGMRGSEVKIGTCTGCVAEHANPYEFKLLNSCCLFPERAAIWLSTQF